MVTTLPRLQRKNPGKIIIVLKGNNVQNNLYYIYIFLKTYAKKIKNLGEIDKFFEEI